PPRGKSEGDRSIQRSGTRNDRVETPAWCSLPRCERRRAPPEATSPRKRRCREAPGALRPLTEPERGCLAHGRSNAGEEGSQALPCWTLKAVGHAALRATADPDSRKRRAPPDVPRSVRCRPPVHRGEIALRRLLPSER